MTTLDMSQFARLRRGDGLRGRGRAGLIDIPLHQIVPGSSVAGPARTVRCGQADNLMVHAVLDQAQPGEVLVLTMPEPEPVALIGELLATQALVHQVAAILVDAAGARYRGVARAGSADLGALDTSARRDQDAASARSMIQSSSAARVSLRAISLCSMPMARRRRGGAGRTGDGGG